MSRQAVATKATSANEESAPELPRGYWPADAVRRILDKTLSYRLEADLSDLRPSERRAIDELVAAGTILDDLNHDQRHHQALRARQVLEELHERLGRPTRTRELLDLYKLFQGPIATTLENELQPFLPVDGFTKGKSLYPWAIERDEIDRFLEAHPERHADILATHTIVRRTTPRALRRDLLTLRRHPTLAVLHPGFAHFVEDLATHPEREAFYAVPYSIAWPGPLLDVSQRLSAAAVALAGDEPDTATFFRQRARDLLTDDNEAGDAAWIRGEIGRLDAVIGAYEVYDDDLFGAKAFFGLALLLRDEPATELLRAELAHLQEIEDALPYGGRRRVSSEIPVVSVNVVAAFGGGRTAGAEILPNDPTLMRKYGRKILVRRNIYMHPEAFARVRTRWEAAVFPDHYADLTPEGRYQQTVWHEIGHYLGPDTDRNGRSLDASLEVECSPIEELKAELVSQFATNRLRTMGLVSDADARGVAASAVLASLRPVRPLRFQPYPTLWLMQLNYFLEQGALVYETGSLGIRYDRQAEAVEGMLAEVLDIQEEGSAKRAAEFINRYSGWDERHETLARAMQAAERYRYLDDRYGLLEPDDPDGDGATGASSRR
jgi:hypothetical protein